MSKTGNLILFFLIAFIFNIALMLAFMAIIISVTGLIMGPSPNPNVVTIVLSVGFIASVILTFVIYGWVMKKASARFNLEKHIPQMFKKKK